MSKNIKNNEKPTVKVGLQDKLTAYFGLLVLVVAAFRGVQLQTFQDQNVSYAIAFVVVVYSALSIVRITKH